MFSSIGWGEILVLVVVGLFVLGPERLPDAAAWLGRTIRQVREYATNAREQLRSEVGSDFDELQKPLQELRNLRGMNPKRMVSQHLLDGLGAKDFGLSDLDADDTKPNGHPKPKSSSGPAARPLEPGERPPIDPDAT